MGAAESTTRTNETRKEEEEERQRASGGSSTAAGAAMALAAVGVAAWGISRMVSDNKEKDDKMKRKGTLTEAQPYRLPNSRNYSHEGYGLTILESNPGTGWSPPPLGRFKMNTDASCLQNQLGAGSDNTGLSGYAGVIRNHRGKWVQAFHGFIGVTDSLTAEFYGIYYGLRLLDKLGFKEATLESDSEFAVYWVNQENNSNNSNSQIIINCWDMITESSHLRVRNKIRVIHCLRKSNKLADKLAAMAVEKQDEYKEITDIPSGEIQRIVDEESRFA